MNEIKFFGTDILKYYWYLIQNQFADSSWQITISYSIVLICIVAILVVTIGFLRRHKKRTKSQKMRKKLEQKYGEIVKDLLLDDSKTEIDVYEEDMFQLAIFDDNPRPRSQVNKSCMKNDKDLFIEDGILYEKPYLEIIMENDEKFLRYMDTVEDIYAFLVRKGISMDSIPITRI